MANPEFEMPTLREIEVDLALGSDSWTCLLVDDKPAVAPRSDHKVIPLPLAGALWNWFRGRQSTSRWWFEQHLSRP